MNHSEWLKYVTHIRDMLRLNDVDSLSLRTGISTSEIHQALRPSGLTKRFLKAIIALDHSGTRALEMEGHLLNFIETVNDTSEILKFRNPSASYKVDEHLEFIKSIDNLKVRHIFASVLGDYVGDSCYKEDNDVYNLTRRLNVTQREWLRRQLWYFTKLPSGFIYLLGQAESFGCGGEGREYGYADYTVGLGFLEYAKSCFSNSVFGSEIRVHDECTSAYPKIYIEVKGKYTKLFDLIQLVRHD